MAIEWKVYVYVAGYTNINGMANIVIFHASDETAADNEIIAIKAATDFHTIDNIDIEVNKISAVEKVLVEVQV